jgi:folate-dependent phosphoribosylglycinamide formyltransferase PurN
MNIGVFAYNFPHWKTQEGINNLIINGYKPKLILATNPVKLNFYQSKIRITPKDLYLHHPKDLAKFYDIPYKIIVHNSQETADLVKEYNLDLGIILGARILKPIAFKNFNIGVLNMHPGILPENRGLDNVKWAVINNYPQGVTTHLIDDKIDRGKLIDKQTIKIYKDDTLMDFHIRIQNLEQKMMIEALKLIPSIKKFKKLDIGNYYKSLPPEIEDKLNYYLDKYKNQK